MSPGHTRVVSVQEQDSCPVREVLDRVGDKWSVLAVFLLAERPMRFNELRRSIEGISQRMLSLTLRRLERDGLVSRTVEPTTPPQVTYTLTELGLTLITAVEALVSWANEHRHDVEAARQSYDTSDSDSASA